MGLAMCEGGTVIVSSHGRAYKISWRPDGFFRPQALETWPITNSSLTACHSPPQLRQCVRRARALDARRVAGAVLDFGQQRAVATVPFLVAASKVSPLHRGLLAVEDTENVSNQGSEVLGPVESSHMVFLVRRGGEPTDSGMSHGIGWLAHLSDWTQHCTGQISHCTLCGRSWLGLGFATPDGSSLSTTLSRRAHFRRGPRRLD